MTCIVAVVRDGKAFIGGDSASVGGQQLSQRSDPKVFAKDGYLFGFTSSWRMGQILRYRFTPPRRHPSDDLMEHMSTNFIDAVRECLKEYGFARIDSNEERGGTFIVATEGRIFKVDDDFQIGETIHPYDACGCGEDIALGALYAMFNDFTNRKKVAPRIMVERALRAAEAFSSGVRGPFKVLDAV